MILKSRHTQHEIAQITKFGEMGVQVVATLRQRKKITFRVRDDELFPEGGVDGKAEVPLGVLLEAESQDSGPTLGEVRDNGPSRV